MIYPEPSTGDLALCAAYSAADTYPPDRMAPSPLFNPYRPEADYLGIIDPVILEEEEQDSVFVHRILLLSNTSCFNISLPTYPYLVDRSSTLPQ
jgi:hypothetical protein